MFDDVSLVAEDGHAVAVFTLPAEQRAALADALSWHLHRRFQVSGLETEATLELRAAGALADRLDHFRDTEGRAEVRVNAHQARLVIEAAAAYLSERDTDSYQPPEERARLEQLSALIDPLFDLVSELDRADSVLSAQSR